MGASGSHREIYGHQQACQTVKLMFALCEYKISPRRPRRYFISCVGMLWVLGLALTGHIIADFMAQDYSKRVHRKGCNGHLKCWKLSPKIRTYPVSGHANLIHNWVCTCKTLESWKGRDLKRSKADRTTCRDSLVPFKIGVSADPQISWKWFKMQMIVCKLRESKGFCLVYSLIWWG